VTFYAYVHARPDTTDSSGVFYVGKGRGKRFRALPARNRYHGFVLAKHGAENVLTSKIECSSDDIAFELERGLIKCLRRAGAELTNMTDGGDGTSGHVVTEEGLARRSEGMKARWADPEERERLRASIRAANIESWADPETRANRANAMKGHRKTMTSEAVEARRKNLEKARTPEAQAKFAEAVKDQWSDPAQKAKHSDGMRAAWKDPVKRASMLANRKNKRASHEDDPGGKDNTQDSQVFLSVSTKETE